MLLDLQERVFCGPMPMDAVKWWNHYGDDGMRLVAKLDWNRWV
jgi:hypothetical protein